jgi:hypothetical protein
VSDHHIPERAGQDRFGPLTALHAADAIKHDLEGGGGSQPSLLDTDHLERLGLMAHLPAWRKAIQDMDQIA